MLKVAAMKRCNTRDRAQLPSADYFGAKNVRWTSYVAALEKATKCRKPTTAEQVRFIVLSALISHSSEEEEEQTDKVWGVEGS